jgi:nitroreductase
MSSVNTPATLLLSVIEAAVQAPSSHNTQPWLFRLRPDTVDLVADRTRALPVNDPDDRELVISCGAALFNLRVAAAHAGWATTVEIRPDPQDPDLLASVHLRDGAPVEDLAALLEQVERRRTHRGRFDDEKVAANAVADLREAAEAEGAELHLLEADRRVDVAALVAEGDRLQFADPRWRRELAAWMHHRRKGDGLGVPLLALPVTRLVLSTLDLGASTAAKDRDRVDDSPILAVLSTDDDSAEEWLAAGQALQRLLLVGAGHGLQGGYLNQPCQVSELRPRLRSLIPGGRAPQVVLRLGYPAEGGYPGPRRDVAEVLL